MSDDKKITDNVNSGGGYYMSDKGGYLCRWKYIDKAYSLHESDYKDPPAILIIRKKNGESIHVED